MLLLLRLGVHVLLFVHAVPCLPAAAAAAAAAEQDVMTCSNLHLFVP